MERFFSGCFFKPPQANDGQSPRVSVLKCRLYINDGWQWGMKGFRVGLPFDWLVSLSPPLAPKCSGLENYKWDVQHSELSVERQPYLNLIPHLHAVFEQHFIFLGKKDCGIVLSSSSDRNEQGNAEHLDWCVLVSLVVPEWNRDRTGLSAAAGLPGSSQRAAAAFRRTLPTGQQ